MKKTRCNTIGALAVSLLAFTATSQAAILAEYDFDVVSGDANLSATTVETGVTAGDAASGTGFSIFTTGLSTLFTSGGVGLNGGTGASPSPFDLDEYFTVSLSAANGGETINIDTIDFDIGRANNGARSWSVRSDVDSFGADLASGTISTTLGGITQIALGASHDNLTSVEFRVYLFGRESTSNSSSATQIDNLEFNGAVIPEPASSMLLLGGAGFLLLRRRRA